MIPNLERITFNKDSQSFLLGPEEMVIPGEQLLPAGKPFIVRYDPALTLGELDTRLKERIEEYTEVNPTRPKADAYMLGSIGFIVSAGNFSRKSDESRGFVAVQLYGLPSTVIDNLKTLRSGQKA